MIVSRKRYNNLIAKIDDDIDWQQRKIVYLENKYNDMKTERDTLIDDLKVLREKNEKLRKLKDIKEKALKGATYIIENQKATIKRLEQENAQLKEKNERLQKAHSDGWKEKDKVIKKLHYLYTTLTDHIRLKAKNNPGVSRYIALVNFVDRLEESK
ncbi:hypothetical protein [Staphylococcus succinus]|uniref:hypothetical protein n=1 Tax=Staphylococcus succinus TaxID=61015 RepID=UPI001C03F344|nr:hypothetical protein [Staphylococcus succinus]MBU0437776.1 hypothetical protein [Staphylococcus succinus]